MTRRLVGERPIGDACGWARQKVRFKRGPLQKQGARPLLDSARERGVPGRVPFAGADDEIVVDGPARLDTFVLRSCPALSRRVAHRLIDDGLVRVNGRIVPKGTRLVAGDRVTVASMRLEPEPDLAVAVVHVDERLIVVDKPGGMPAHALDPRQRGTVAAYLAGRFPETDGLGGPLTSGLVHRLDTGTSGLLLAARTPEAYAALRAAFRAGAVGKHYLALVAGVPPARAAIDRALAHDPRDRRRMIVAQPGLRAWAAHTEIATLRAARGRALVDVTLHTGVTHQARVHLALLGCPVLGDTLYGGPDAGLPPGRHALHAAALALADTRRFESALPPDLATLAPP
jgi:23S rRNA pseudouridine1911/1915/1917 synthase